MRCAFSTRAHAADYIIEIARSVREAGGHLLGLGGKMASCTGSNMRDRHGCCATSAVWLCAIRRSIRLVNYLHKRKPLMDYPSYQQQGWPIGSGSVERSHKFVVQARRVWLRDALEA